MKTFDTIDDLVQDPYFKDELKKLINVVEQDRLNPPPHKRDWYDRMYAKNQFNADFFNANFGAVVGKTSNLPSQTRQIVIHVYNEVFNSTLLAYQKDDREREETGKKAVK